MGRGRGKGKKLAIPANHEDPGSDQEAKDPVNRKKGWLKNPLKEEIDEDESKNIEEAENESEAAVAGKDMAIPPLVENGKKRKQHSLVKKNTVPIKEEKITGMSSSTSASVNCNGYRQNGNRRKSKPRRAAEVGVECK